MDWPILLTAFRELKVGKRVGTACYFHSELVETLPEPLRAFLLEIPERVGLVRDEANVFKVELLQGRVSLLSYPGFWEEGFPRLKASWTIDPEEGSSTCRRFDLHDNPPILHRKELLLPSHHSALPHFQALTAAAEAAGLFANTQTIGRLRVWERELAARGLRVEGHTLLPLGPVGEATKPEQDPVQLLEFSSSSGAIYEVEEGGVEEVVLRHKTAITRRTLSAPMQALWRHGFLDGSRTVFDYGCGQGDDVRALEEAGVSVHAWDPHFRPSAELLPSEVVNLGFVINVIEDPLERRRALENAFALATHVLSVATLIGGRSAYERFRLFRDGVLTSIGTFQKYYTQPEFEGFIEEVLGREPVTIAPGIVFVFKTDEQEQDFLAQRQRWRWRLHARHSMPRVERPVRHPREPRWTQPQKTPRWIEHEELLDGFWLRCLELGRLPEEGEFAREEELRQKLGTPKRVLNHLLKTYGETPLEQARAERMGDTCVYLALGFFARRASFGGLSRRIRRDIKAFWGSHKVAVDEAQRLLFSIADTEVIHQACIQAAAKGLGYLDGEHSLQLHSSLAAELPAVLRIYLGCAVKLYGDVEEADLLKLHIQSGKVTLLLYDDFDGLEVPNLVERVKIDLRRQHVDFFEYGGEFPAEPLLNKAVFLRGQVD